MNRAYRTVRHLFWPPLAIVLLGLALPANAGDTPNRDANTVAARHSITGSTVAELRRHMDANDLTDLRTVRNGTYGASLLFYPDKLTYYVTLSHGKDFWRVIKTDVVADAENVYRTFAKQSEKLAQVDIDTIRLEAGKKYTQHLLSINKERLDSLRQDLRRQRQQAQQVAKAQQQSKQQAINLTGDLQSTSSELVALRQRIRQLESQQANPELLLPKQRQPPLQPIASDGDAPTPVTTTPDTTRH